MDTGDLEKLKRRENESDFDLVKRYYDVLNRKALEECQSLVDFLKKNDDFAKQENNIKGYDIANVMLILEMRLFKLRNDFKMQFIKDNHDPIIFLKDALGSEKVFQEVVKKNFDNNFKELTKIRDLMYECKDL